MEEDVNVARMWEPPEAVELMVGTWSPMERKMTAESSLTEGKKNSEMCLILCA